MTGFGSGAVRLKKGKIIIEIKTVNHKFFDASLKLPPSMSIFDDRIKEVLQKKIHRGKVNLNLIHDGELLKPDNVRIDHKIAANYYRELTKLGKYLGLKQELSAKDIMLLPGVFNYEAAGADIVKIWPKVKDALDKAISMLLSNREKEGKALFADLDKRARIIEKLLATIKSRAHLNIAEYRKKFSDRIRDLTDGRSIDAGRLEMEVAIFAKNSDIAEEITRLSSHLSNFRKTIAGSGEVGKKLDFIAQELHREINTIGSKASDFQIAKCVIEIKGEIEKIREQSKNLE